jgi:hypothetical protein
MQRQGWANQLGASWRGGAFNNNQRNTRAAYRNNNNPNNRNNNLGFRVAEPLSKMGNRKCGISQQVSPRSERCTLALPVLLQAGGAAASSTAAC